MQGGGYRPLKKVLTSLVVVLFVCSMFSIFTPQVKAEVAWTKYSGNPLNLGDNVSSPRVLLDGATYKMWYCSGGDIYYATSSDGISWNAYGKVLQKGAANSWEAGLTRFSVILDGTTYKMWYGGYSPIEQYGRIGYATSSDGVSWTKYGGNPVLVPGGNGGWDDWNVFGPSVLKDGSTYKMWYCGQNYEYSPLRIGYATSSDGVSWTKYGGNPVLVPGGNGGWDDTHVSIPFVMKDGVTYEMWYTGSVNPSSYWIGIAFMGAPPTIQVLSPQNLTYTTASVPLTFTVTEPTSWMGYSLDNQANVTITGNTTLTGLSDGPHNVIVYANDTAGNMGSSSRVYFAVALPPPPPPPAVGGVVVPVNKLGLFAPEIVLGLLILSSGVALFIKRRKKQE